MRLRYFGVILLVAAIAALAFALGRYSVGSQAVGLQATAVPTFGPLIGGPPVQLPTATQVPGATTAPTTIPPTAAPPTRVPPTAVTTAAPPTAVPTAAPPTATKIPVPQLKSDLMGIQAYGYVGNDDWFTLMDRTYFMGFKWIKIQLSWKELEPEKGKFSAQFERIKQTIFETGKFRGAGYKMLLGVAKAPDWARPANARGQQDGPPVNPQDLVDFLNAVFNTFEMSHVGAIEIWNEANTTTEWTGSTLNGATYVKLFNPAYQFIRSKSKDIVVVSAGPNPTIVANLGSDRDWLQQIYTAGLPINDPNFVIGAHPYGWANAPDVRCCPKSGKGWDDQPFFFFLDTLYDYRNIMVKNKHALGKIWVTEFGWSAFLGHYKGAKPEDGPPALPPAEKELAWMNMLNEQQQAQYIIRAFELAQTGELATFVGPMFLWNLNFSMLPGFIQNDKPSLPEAGFSILYQNSLPRPVYYLLQEATGPK